MEGDIDFEKDSLKSDRHPTPWAMMLLMSRYQFLSWNESFMSSLTGSLEIAVSYPILNCFQFLRRGQKIPLEPAMTDERS